MIIIGIIIIIVILIGAFKIIGFILGLYTLGKVMEGVEREEKERKRQYEILGIIDSSATDEDVKKAYNKMVNQYHPDKVSHLGEEFQLVAEEKLKTINNAYEMINYERRKKAEEAKEEKDEREKERKRQYEILGIDSLATNEDIEKAYNKMINQYHPDKLLHLGEEFQLVAEKKLKGINNAYEKIKGERGIK